MLTLLALACSGPTPTQTGSPTDPPDGPFAGVAFEGAAETGVILGMWSNGPEAILVGGDLGSAGRITHYDGEGFCVEPTSYERALWWVHGRAPGDWYAVGERGIVLHEQNGVRTRVDLPTLATLFGVYDDGTDVFAVGGDVLNTQTGQIWRKAAGEDWELLLGDIPGLMFKVQDGWFVGDGLAYRWNGTALEEHHPSPVDGAARPPKLLTVRSFGPTRAVAVGGVNRATVLSYDNGTWTPIEVPQECSGGQGLNGVFGTDPAELYIAGHRGAASRYDGAWTCDVPPLTEEHFHVAWEHEGEVLFGGGDLFDFGNNHGTVAIHPDRGSLPVTVCE